MTHYIRESLAAPSVLSPRRPVINAFFLSSYTLSIYQGCEFGCSYCDGWVYDAQNFNRSIRVPIDLPQRLDTELDSVPQGDLIAITPLSDAYQPAEQSYRLTRQVLQLFAAREQPCLVMTKSPLILEDLELLRQINERSLAIVMTTLLTVDHGLAGQLEGRSPLPALRLDMLAALKREGIPVGVALVPIIPYVNDTDYIMQRVLRACADVGVDFVVWDYLYLPNRYHANRVLETLAHVRSFMAQYYRDVYNDQIFPSEHYRKERDIAMLRRCDALGLNVHAPHSLYAGKLSPRNEAALLFKHAALRNSVQGQERLAALHRTLADQTYRAEASLDDLRASPIWPRVQAIPGFEA